MRAVTVLMGLMLLSGCGMEWAPLPEAPATVMAARVHQVSLRVTAGKLSGFRQQTQHGERRKSPLRRRRSRESTSQ